VVLTKADLGDPAEIVELLAPLGVRIIVTRFDEDLATLREVLIDKFSALVGHSGVGKSTLVNALIPDARRATSHVNEVTGRGRHTSTSAIAMELPFGGWIVDTPGIRSFGLAHVTADDILRAFSDLEEASRHCSRGCTHATAEPECGLDAAVAAGDVSPERVSSFRRLLSTNESTNG
ncbi:MAG: rsgA, partial [Nocardioidaceae bacterium]|nr:rsgA [Nocardioidaceae bacterium]